MRSFLERLWGRRSGGKLVRGRARIRCCPTVEGLEHRLAPSVDVTSGIATLQGTAGADQFQIRLEQGDASTVQIVDNGVVHETPLSGLSQIQVNGGQGADTLTIDNSNGLVGGSGGLTIRFDGGDGFDRLVLTGDLNSAGVTETYTPGTGSTAGTLAFTGSSGTQTVQFFRVSEVVDTTTVTTLTIQGTEERDVMHLLGGRSVNGVSTVRFLTAGTGVLEDMGATNGTGTQVCQGTSTGGTNPTAPINRDDGGSNGTLNNQTSDDTSTGGATNGGATGTGTGLATANTNATASGDCDDDGDVIVIGERFTRVSFGNKTNLRVNLLGGNDFLNLNGLGSASGLRSIVVDGGAGVDHVVARRLPAGVTAEFPNVERVNQATEDSFILRLYEIRLHRAATEQELAFWRNVLQNLNVAPSVVAELIERSPEARTRLVREWYAKFLGREARGGEEQFWVFQLLAGRSEEEVLSGILGSDEFLNRAGTLFSNGTGNERFIRTLYRTILDRTATAGEVAFWQGVLQQVRRHDVVLFFLRSTELRQNLVEDLYESLLFRGSDDVGRNFWVRSVLDMTRIRIGILGSPEFFNEA